MFFSKDLYIQGLKKVRAAGIGSAITVLVLNTLYAYVISTFGSKKYITTLEGGVIAPFTFLTALFGLLIVSSAFSFLNKRKDSDFYHGLPQKRICVYFSLLASALTWIVAINLSTIIINSIIFELSKGYTISILGALLVFIGNTLSAFTAAGIITICRMIAGTKTALVFYTVSAFAIPRILFRVFEVYIVEELNPSIVINKSWLRFLSTDNSLYFSLYDSWNEKIGAFANPTIYITLLAESAALFAIGAFLYQKRKSELAGQSAGTKIVQTIFRTAVTVPFIFTAILCFISGEDVSAIILLVLSLLFYFLFELILSKSAKKALTGMGMYIIPLIVSLALIASTFATAEGFRATSPKIDDIQSVTFMNSINGYKSPLTVNEVTLQSETAKKMVLDALHSRSEHFLEDFHFHYAATVKFTLKNGKEKYRTVYFTEDDLNILLKEANNSR